MKLVVPERGSGAAATLWRAAGRLISSPLVYPEARAAIGRARRAGRLPGTRARRARSLLDRLLEEVDWAPLTRDVLWRAGGLADTEGLRAYDAVHLAAFELSGRLGAVLITADRELAEAARRLGYAVAVPDGP